MKSNEYQEQLNLEVAVHVYHWFARQERGYYRLFDSNGSPLGAAVDIFALMSQYVPRWSTNTKLASDLANDVGLTTVYEVFDLQTSQQQGWAVSRPGGILYYGATEHEAICAGAIELVRDDSGWKPPYKKTSIVWEI